MTIKEKRKFPRILVDYVTVEVYSTASQNMNSLDVVDICPVINLSENGMLFTADHPITDGQLLRLTFNLPHSMVIIRTDAIVIRAAQKKGAIEVGVQFSNIDVSEQKLIKHFVDKNMNTTA